MNATASSSRPSYGRDLAPHVEKQWAEAFIVELRLQEVAGKNVGAALAEVNSHCAEAEESAQEVFGDPVTYAKSLQLPEERPRSMFLRLLPTAVQIIGFMTLIQASPSYIPGDPVVVTAGDLGMWGILVAVVVMMAWQVRPFMTLVARRPVIATLGLAAIVIVMVFPVLLWRQPVAELPVVGAIIFGGAFLVVGTVWELRRVHAEASDEQISRPLDSPDELTRGRRSGLRIHYLRIFSFPVAGGLLAGFVVLLG